MNEQDLVTYFTSIKRSIETQIARPLTSTELNTLTVIASNTLESTTTTEQANVLVDRIISSFLQSINWRSNIALPPVVGGLPSSLSSTPLGAGAGGGGSTSNAEEVGILNDIKTSMELLIDNIYLPKSINSTAKYLSNERAYDFMVHARDTEDAIKDQIAALTSELNTVNLKLNQVVPGFNVYNILVDSRNRQILSNPSPHNYRMSFQDSSNSRGAIKNVQEMKNILSIEFVRGSIPNFIKQKTGGTVSFHEPYLLLIIEEITAQLYTASDKKNFTMLTLDPKEIAEGAPFLTLHGLSRSDSTRKAIPFPFVNALTVRITDWAGNDINFGEDGIVIDSITTTTPAEINLSSFHNIDSGDKIYIVETVGSDIDSVLNRSAGHCVSVKDPTTLVLNDDTISLTTQATGGFILVAKRQNYFQFNITTS